MLYQLYDMRPFLYVMRTDYRRPDKLTDIYRYNLTFFLAFFCNSPSYHRRYPVDICKSVILITIVNLRY